MCCYNNINSGYVATLSNITKIKSIYLDILIQYKHIYIYTNFNNYGMAGLVHVFEKVFEFHWSSQEEIWLQD